MLTKKTGAGETHTLYLACDPSVRAAQDAAALERLREADAAGGQAEALREFARLSGSDAEAHARLTPGDAPTDRMVEPVLQWMARAAAATVLERYRASCDASDLLDIPDDATTVVVRIPSSTEMHRVDSAGKPCPEVGRLRYQQAAIAARAADNARGACKGYREALAAARAAVSAEVDATAQAGGKKVAAAVLDAARAAKGAGGKMITALADAIDTWAPTDGWGSAHARYLDALPAAERREVQKYLAWHGETNAARFTAFVESVSGLDLQRGLDGYPTQALLDCVREGPAVVSEGAQAAWTLSTLGKPQRLPSPSPSGSPTSEGEATADASSAPPATSTATCGSAAGDAADPCETISPPVGGEAG